MSQTAQRCALVLSSRLLRSNPLLLALLVCLGPLHARADGAHIALRATSGAYSITLFTAPEPLLAGPADFSLLVQDAATGEVLGDASATATLTPSSGKFAPVEFPLTHARAGNKLLLAGEPVLPAAGGYTLALRVLSPADPPASFTARLTAEPDHRRRTTLLFGLGLPLAAILLFLVNQKARRGRRLRLYSALH